MIIKKIRTIFCLLSLIGCGHYLQAQQYDLKEVNDLVDYYLEHSQLVNAFNLLTNASDYYFDQEDFSVSYELKRRCCLLLDEHIDDFYDYGLTPEGYFEHWYVAISLARRIQRTDEAVPFLLTFLRKMEKKLPEMLPYYTTELAYILGECRGVGGYADSIYILQNSLDVIKRLPVEKEQVIQYNKISHWFIANRIIKSLDNNGHLVENKIGEIEKWYLNNRQYVCSLDTSQYKAQILEYELEYIGELMSFAQTISAQKKEYKESNELYKKAIDILQPLLALNDTLSQKIAACNAGIGRNYSMIHEYALCREYSDKAFGVLFNYKEDFDYCDIIDVIASNYFESGQFKLAAALRLREIIVRAKLGWQHTKSDWSVYFLYELCNQPEKILEYKDIALYFSEESSPESNASLLLDIGKAYSMLMDSITDYRDSAKSYLTSAGNYITTYKETIKRNESYAELLRSLYAAWANYYQRLGQLQKSYEYDQKALNILDESTWNHYGSAYFESLVLKSSYLCDTVGLHRYLPLFYNRLEKEIIEILPVLGVIESSNYMASHGSSLYQIPEWTSWNPKDEISCGVAYDAALLMKGLLLSHTAHILQTDGDSNQSIVIHRLEQLRDSIYDITDDIQRWQTLHQYEKQERQILAETNRKQLRVHWKDVQRGLHKEEACIEFVKYYKNGYAWSNADLIPHYGAIVLSNNNHAPSFVDLFDEEELLDVYRYQPKSYDIEQGKVLYSKIWGKLQQYMDGKERVFFSPVGLLSLMNIELLTDSSGLTALQRFNLYRVSSTKNVIIPSNERKPAYAVTFGDIDYDNAQTVLDSLNTRGNWSYLKNTQYEINRLKELFSENNISITTNVGEGATEALFKALDGTNADIVHVASHGYYIPRCQRESIPYFAKSESTKNVQDELFYSGLIMSGGQKGWTDSTFGVDSNDGILTAYEISKLDLHNVSLVVLSACETGLGDDLLDGIYGLQRAFKKAGAGSILMSLWKIDDKATSEFMGMFYEKLVKGYSKHEAYTYATHTMKEKYQDANYWASFILLD